MELCGICQVRVEQEERGMECDGCKRWFHAECIDMQKEDYEKVLKISDRARMKWYCLKCEKKSEGLQKENVILKKENSTLKEEIAELKNLMQQMMEKVEKMEETVERRIEEELNRKCQLVQGGFDIKVDELRYGINMLRDEVAELKNRNTDNIGETDKEQDREERKREIEQIKRDLVKDVNEGVEEVRKERDVEERKVNELQYKMDEIEREGKKKNVIMFNLEESKKDDARERYREDEARCKEIFTDILEIHQINIQKVIRLGKMVQDRTRPVLVKLGNEDERMKILKNANKIRHSKKFVKVYIARDMTEKEREKDKSLRQELKEKREKEDEWYVIRRGKVVKAEGRQRERQAEGGRKEQGARPKENRNIR